MSTILVATTSPMGDVGEAPAPAAYEPATAGAGERAALLQLERANGMLHERAARRAGRFRDAPVRRRGGGGPAAL